MWFLLGDGEVLRVRSRSLHFPFPFIHSLSTSNSVNPNRACNADPEQISGELVVVLAVCSSVVNFAISFSVQPSTNATNYGWAFTFFGILVVLSIMALPMIAWGKSWRECGKKRYTLFLQETGVFRCRGLLVGSGRRGICAE